MARSQRHRVQIQGTLAREPRGTIPTLGTYNGSHMRAGATAGANLRTRAGGSTAENGTGGSGTTVGGFVGVVGSPKASTGHVGGYIAPTIPRAQ